MTGSGTISRPASGTEISADPIEALGQLLNDGTAALAHLDAESLELLQVRAVQLHLAMNQGNSETSGSAKATLELASRHRVFAEVLRATGEHLKLLRRINGNGMNGSGRMSPWDR